MRMFIELNALTGKELAKAFVINILMKSTIDLSFRGDYF